MRVRPAASWRRASAACCARALAPVARYLSRLLLALGRASQATLAGNMILACVRSARKSTRSCQLATSELPPAQCIRSHVTPRIRPSARAHSRACATGAARGAARGRASQARGASGAERTPVEVRYPRAVQVRLARGLAGRLCSLAANRPRKLESSPTERSPGHRLLLY